MLSRYLISIRVWGIECRLFSSRFYHSLLTDRRNRLHTFLFYLPAVWESGWKKSCYENFAEFMLCVCRNWYCEEMILVKSLFVIMGLV